MRVENIMTKHPDCCTPDSKLDEVARMMVTRDCGQIPVVESWEKWKVVGVVTDRDIVVRSIGKGKNPLEMTASDVMSKPAITITPETELEDCCRTLEDKRVRRAPVVDQRGHCIGMIALADVARHAPGRTTARVVQEVSQPVHA